jgi:hypothetical protein
MSDISSINEVSDGFSEHYTPTTEEVRDVYQSRLIKVGDNRFELIDQVQADAEFDRWLTEVKAEAWQEGMMSVKKHVSCWPKQDKLPSNPYIPEIGKETE